MAPIGRNFEFSKILQSHSVHLSIKCPLSSLLPSLPLNLVGVLTPPQRKGSAPYESYIRFQWFIQAILMSGRQHKKLNLHKILLQNTLALNFHSKKNSLIVFFYFKLFIFPQYIKRPKCFRDFNPLESPPRVCQELAVKIKAPWDLHLHFITFENSIYVQNVHY